MGELSNRLVFVRTAISENWRKLGHPAVLGIWMHVVSTLLYVVVLFSFEIPRNGVFQAQWFIPLLSSQLAFSGTLALGRFTGNRSAPTKTSRPFANLLTVLSAAAIRALVFGFSAAALGLVASPNYAPRFWGALTVGLGLTFGVSQILTSRINHEATVQGLLDTQAQLSAQQKNAKLHISQVQESLKRRAQDALLPQLLGLDRAMSHAGYDIEARNQIVERIRQVIVEDVHPLSRELVSKASKIQSSMEVQERQTKPRIVWPTTVMVRDATRVFALALIGLANVFVLFQAYAGGTWGLSASAAWLASMGFLALLKLLIPQNWRAPFYLGALFIAGLTLIGITPYILVTQLLAPSVAQLGALKFSGPAIAPIISVSLAYASAIAQDRARYEFALDNANAQLAREIILVEQQLWIARRAWAYLIHGNVQASLTAAILQLNRPAAQSTDRDAALASVQHAIEALKSPADLRIDLRTALDEIATTWTGTCDVKFDFAPDLLEEFGSSDSVSLCLNEIFKEAVSNAIRHGAATEVTCSVLKDADGQLHVRVINNGSPLISSRRSSMGTQLFDELCTKWTLSSDVSSGKTTLEAWVPTS